jgi:transposase InsO family protein
MLASGLFIVELEKYMVKYNNYRPHQSLDSLTPMEYCKKQMTKAGDFFPGVIN